MPLGAYSPLKHVQPTNPSNRCLQAEPGLPLLPVSSSANTVVGPSLGTCAWVVTWRSLLTILEKSFKSMDCEWPQMPGWVLLAQSFQGTCYKQS